MNFTGKTIFSLEKSGKYLFSCLFLIALCSNPHQLFSQTYPTRNYTMNDGLPSMSIRCIYKDSRGLFWLGTDAGLCSYDGKSFRIYKSNEGMTASKIWAITEDEDANLWFGSYGDGLYKYDGRHFERYTTKNGMVSNYIRVLVYSQKFHCLIAGAEGGVNTIRENTISASPSEMFTTDKGRTVTGLCETGNFIYVTTYGHQNPIRYYPDQNKFVSVHDTGKHYPIHSFSCFLSSNGDTLFSNQNKGIWLYGKKEIFKCDTLGQVFSITEDKHRNIWLAAWSYQNMKQKGGIFRYDGRSVQAFKTTFGITDREIWTVYYDPKEDILWVGTINEGLYKVSFSNIVEFTSAYFQSAQKINNLYLDSGNSLWISGSHELIKMNTSDQSFTRLDKRPMILAYRQFWNHPLNKKLPPMGETMKAAKDLNFSELTLFEKQIDFNFNKVTEDTKHSIIFSSELGLFRRDFATGVTNYLGQEGALGEFASMGDTLIVSVWGPTALNPRYKSSRLKYDNSRFFPLKLFTQFTQTGDPHNVTRLVKHDNQYWYTSWVTGLWVSEGMQLTNLNQTDSTINNNLNDICFDESDHVIFGSNHGEICIASYSNRKLKIDYRINSENGLHGNSVFWLVADKNGKLWAGTNRGLNCIDLNELFANNKCIVRFFDEEEGYSGQTAKHAVIDSAGNLWIGAGKNLIKLDTKKLLAHQIERSSVILKEIQINNQPISNFLHADKLNKWTSVPTEMPKFKQTENDLTFHFDILNYRNSTKDKFRYYLKGYDKTWNNWSENRIAVYTNLPHGKYTFCIESFNSNTNTEALPIVFDFVVRPFWWEIWYVRLLILIVWSALIFVALRKYFRIRKTNLQRKLEIEKTIATLKMQALQAQMNPHFIFNCINGIQYYVLANKMDQVLSYLSDFSKVIRESLSNANRRMVTLNQEIEFLKSYLHLEQMRFPDKFNYSIQCEKENTISFVQIPPMLVQPFVENAIRHGFSNLMEKGQLSILFQPLSGDVLKCTITDNGVGRKKTEVKLPNQMEDRLHSGKITETRLNLFNTGELPDKYKIVYTDLNNENGTPGLKVEIYLPMEIVQG